MMKIRQQDGN